jgi:hypothetical protein
MNERVNTMARETRGKWDGSRNQVSIAPAATVAATPAAEASAAVAAGRLWTVLIDL